MSWDHKHLLVTGGAGFMGSAFIRYVLGRGNFTGHITNLDLLTYAGNLENVESVSRDERYSFCHGDIGDRILLENIHQARPIGAIIHFAAETHVDRSIEAPTPFVTTNILGTYNLLEFVRAYPKIHFHHISTDEVYGTLGKTGRFDEDSPYRPNSPYSASKASSDHFVRAYHKTYGLKTTLSHASNNYGPGQYPEKLIPLMITRALKKKALPVYGAGENVREWLYVEDHAQAVWTILNEGKSGEVYNVGGESEMSNLSLLHLLLEVIEEEKGEKGLKELISFVPDRPGHDFRYALEGTKMEALGYKPRWGLREGLKATVNAQLKALT
ncbi:MAG: dTDP-glucose 4,6-dehydratase [Chlamydiia bacterium]|nr:dTDP-glucose 4,6-dehydratase [Chlamydiia bacterium]